MDRVLDGFHHSLSDTNTDKPEAIGRIMTRKVKTLPADAHVAELIPLIVADDEHFPAMVFQSRLLSALFSHCIFASVKKDGTS